MNNMQIVMDGVIVQVEEDHGLDNMIPATCRVTMDDGSVEWTDDAFAANSRFRFPVAVSFESWKQFRAKAPQHVNMVTIQMPSIEFQILQRDTWDWMANTPQVALTCECGSDKIASPFHSSWCPKAKP